MENSKGPYQTINTRFHLLLAKLSGNEYIYDVLYPYLGYVARYAIASIERGRFSPETNYHYNILHSLKNKDINTALNYLRLDLQLEKDEIRSCFKILYGRRLYIPPSSLKASWACYSFTSFTSE